MKREIEFRGKRSNGEWVYGFFFYNKDVNPDRKFILTFDMSGAPRESRVDEKSVGQFTGLRDTNGRKIFEGDILRWADGVGDVYFKDGKFMVRDFHLSYQDSPWDAFGENAELEVIGNITDNPELIK